MQSSSLTTILAISRPRFWLYLVGPALIGFAATGLGIHVLQDIKNVLFLFFLSFPMNFFLYGINDYYDRDTDLLNPKKTSHEHLLKQTEDKHVLLGSFLVFVCAVWIFFLLAQPVARLFFAFFVALSFWYSAPPFRFKAQPLWDAYSNVLYALPGFVAYIESTGMLPSTLVVVAAVCWTAALHTFSALPDIKSDEHAGIQTTAVVLGHHKSLVFVGANWLISALLFWYILGWVGMVFLVYPTIIFMLRAAPLSVIERWYWRLPFINAVLGFMGFWYLVLSL